MVMKSRSAASGARLLLMVLTFAAVLEAGEASGAQLTASWIDNSSAGAMTRLERRQGAEVFAAIADVLPGVTEYVDAFVSPGTTYCYRALAYDGAGVSPYTDEACASASTQGYELPVTVSRAGSGGGTVASTPAGILCGSACSATYPSGTAVVLAATPVIDSTFTGWSGGGCVGTAACVLAGNAPVTVTATFDLLTYPVTVAPLGPGMLTSGGCSGPSPICTIMYHDGPRGLGEVHE